MPRVFTAVDIEGEELLNELRRVRERLDLGFKPVSREKMHVTLEFFRDVDTQEIDEIRDSMENTSLEPFRASVKGVGAFPSRDYIRVVWAGIEDGRFHELYDQVSGHGVESSNDHDFTPHITLMRVENVSPGKKKKLEKTLEEFREHRFGPLEVNRVKLLESELTGSGPRYSVLDEVEL